jgi:hypothetical protein
MAKLRGPLIGLLALVVVGATLAVAANPTRSGRITACVDKGSKEMRLASGKNRCRKGERKLRWNQRGPAGARGPAGDDGLTGAPGQPGAPGANASATSRDTIIGENTTSDMTPVALDGPQATVEVPAAGANLILGANYSAKNANGANNSCVIVYEGDTQLGGVGCVASTTYVRNHGAITIAADAGPHTYTLRYQSPAGTLASFQDRTLIVSVLR